MRNYLEDESHSGKTIGFVPTMGALHQGHLELMRRAKGENDLLIVSIFVNPIQFNNPDDLEKYPRTIGTDSEMLESVGCDVLFLPSNSEMYPQPDKTQYEFGVLAQTMEGRFRPGHFNGVAIVVRKLFEIVQPTRSYFGEKDFQQLAIIKQLVSMLNLAVEVVACPIVREADGLAMSSRNMRLEESERQIAPYIYQTLKLAAAKYPEYTPTEIREWVAGRFEGHGDFVPDYVEIADDRMLQPIEKWNDATGAMLFVAVFLGQVRLIDNIRIY
jgi:pantoate--beta-alanine ligase